MKGWHVESFTYDLETQLKDFDAWLGAFAIDILQ
jgi:hypothetical protein